jgi:polysaccharide biosynthesis/export protein
MIVKLGSFEGGKAARLHRQLSGWRRRLRALQTVPAMPATLLLALLCTLLCGCQSDSEPDDYFSAVSLPVAPPVDPGAAAYATNYLQEGDVVSINFMYSTNYNTVQQIGLDGTLNLAGVGHIIATGKSTLQLEKELTELYRDLVKDDPVSVKIAAAATSIYVGGAVIRPGKVPLERPLTVMEAVMEAGGFDPYHANLSSVLVLRVENGRQKLYRVNLKRVLQGRDETPFYLKPSDIVQVQTKTFNF